MTFKSMKFSIIEICASEFTFRQFILPLCKVLCASGAVVASAYKAESLNHKSHFIFFNINLSRSLSTFKLLVSLKEIYVLLKRDNSTIVHVHTPIASYLVRFLLLVPGLLRRRLVVYTVHGFYMHPGANWINFIFHLIVEYVLSFVTDYYIFVSRYDMKLAGEYFPSIPSRSILCPNGVDARVFYPPSEYTRSVSREYFNYDQDNFVIGFVGRLVREKGLTDLIDAFTLCKTFNVRARLMVVGDTLPSDYDGSVKSKLEELRSFYPDSVLLTGMIADKSELLRCFHSMNCFCLPSYREGLPTSLMEAMACGVPCIATDIRGCNELIDHEVNGLLIPPCSPAEIFSSIARLMTVPEFASRLAANARERVSSSYSESRNMEKITRTLRFLCDSAG